MNATRQGSGDEGVLAHNLEANLAALCRNDPELAGRLREPCALSDGGFLEVQRGESGRWAVVRVGGHTLPSAAALDAADRRAQDLVRKLAEVRQGVLLIEDPGLLCARQFAATQPAPEQPAVTVFTVTAELAVLRASLQLEDISPALTNERIVPFGGRSAWDDFTKRLRRQPALRIPDAFISVSGASPELRSAVKSLLEQLCHETLRETEALGRRLDARFAGEPWREAFAGRRPLRLMAIKNLSSTFTQYSLQDIADSAAEAGVEISFMLDRSGHVTKLGWMREAMACRPDVLLLIDHLRGEVGWLPAGMPVVSWIQDTLPHLCTKAAGGGIGPRDFVMGWGKTEMATLYDYPAARFLACGIPTNPRRFPEPPPYAKRDFACDMSYVSHYSAMPESAISEFVKTSLRSEANRRLMVDFHLRLMDELKVGFLRTRGDFRRFLGRFMTWGDRKWDNADSRDEAMEAYRNGPFNHAYRQQVLAWVADMADARGLRLVIYGRGWEMNPRFAKYAGGVADNRKDLGRIAVESRINLHIGFYAGVHQRLLDGLAAGGFFLIFDAADVPPAWAELRRLARRQAGPGGALPEDFCRSLPAGIFDEGMRICAESRLIPPAPDLRSVMESYLECAETDDLTCAFPDMRVAEVLFKTAGELGQLWDRYSSGPEEAQEIQEVMRRAVLEKHTYAALLKKMQTFLRSGLGCTNACGG